MLLDKKGKLFGKISIVDVLVILLIIAVAGGLYYKFGKSGTVTPFTQTQTVQVTLSLESVNQYIANNIKEGDIVQDRVQNITMGKVTSVKTGPDVSYFLNSNGLTIKGSKDGYCSLTVTFEGQGLYKDTGVTFGGVEYYLNKSNVEWRIGNTTNFAKISDIKLIKE
jgi:hypothetical protein